METMHQVLNGVRDIWTSYLVLFPISIILFHGYRGRIPWVPRNWFSPGKPKRLAELTHVHVVTALWCLLAWSIINGVRTHADSVADRINFILYGAALPRHVVLCRQMMSLSGFAIAIGRRSLFWSATRGVVVGQLVCLVEAALVGWLRAAQGMDVFQWDWETESLATISAIGVCFMVGEVIRHILPSKGTGTIAMNLLLTCIVMMVAGGGFWIIPSALGKLLFFFFCLVTLPILLASSKVKTMTEQSFVSMYRIGVAQIPFIGEALHTLLFGSNRTPSSTVPTMKAAERDEEESSRNQASIVAENLNNSEK